MHNYRFTYRHGNDKSRQARIITATTPREAEQKLGPVYSIVSRTIQCEAVTKRGTPCKRFSGDYYCASHR
jgi:hypothetical protein